jgi:molybdopterin-binding protein
MSRHPTVEVISRIALDAAAPLDLTAGAIAPAVMTAGVVVLAHCDLTPPGR